MERLMKVIDIRVLKKNLTQVFKQYKKLYKEEYNDKVFKHHEEDIDLDRHNLQYYQFVMENGFYTFYLMSTYVDY